MLRFVFRKLCLALEHVHKSRVLVYTEGLISAWALVVVTLSLKIHHETSYYIFILTEIATNVYRDEQKTLDIDLVACFVLALEFLRKIKLLLRS